MHEHKLIAILYHGGCPDGFGGAYAAFKKFGDTADYIPLKHGKPIPEHLEGKELYLIDFCYARPQMDQLAAVAKSIVVLDHHEGVRDVATTFPGVFDTNRSGATIAWSYFHPDTPVPTLLQYVEDGDLYRHTLPHAREILSYVYTLTNSFSSLETENVAQWDAFVSDIDTPETFKRVVDIGTFFAQYHEHVVTRGVHRAELVSFEGFECYLASATGEFASDIGNQLARLKPPVAIIVSADAEGIRVSLRSDKSIDVAKIAQKYGGNGHPAAAGFEIPYGDPIPWTPLPAHEDTRD
ncbi:MAG: DHHA1 domain-containing protein [Patescibacteria group bacterium]